MYTKDKIDEKIKDLKEFNEQTFVHDSFFQETISSNTSKILEVKETLNKHSTSLGGWIPIFNII
jgi:hypothetical protein